MTTALEREVRPIKLRSARQAARAALRLAADWLKGCGASDAEIDALRVAYRAIEAADPEAPDLRFAAPLI